MWVKWGIGKKEMLKKAKKKKDTGQGRFNTNKWQKKGGQQEGYQGRLRRELNRRVMGDLVLVSHVEDEHLMVPYACSRESNLLHVIIQEEKFFFLQLC